MYGPRFDVAVSPGGYAWWYVDAFSDDGRDALTLIAFVGSVFSPYYAAARRRGAAAPEEYCSINVALRGRVDRWTMTERGANAVRRSAASLQIGPSALRWQDGSLVATLEERAAPWPYAVRGELRLTPEVTTDFRQALDPAGLHRWQPIAPRARVELRLERPALRWQGVGYLDSNAGDVPLEATFRRWDWSREEGRDGRPERVLYDVELLGGQRREYGFSLGLDGSVGSADAPQPPALSASRWGIERRIRARAGHGVRVARVLEDGPFYTRAEISLEGPDGASRALHETLSLDRFRARWVQALLPFRMPRMPRFLSAARR